MLKVVKFGGSSLADAAQFTKVRDIVRADPDRRFVVVSAVGKRTEGDNKITDLLYLCHAHLQYGVNYESVFHLVEERYLAIRDALCLNVDLEGEFAKLRAQMDGGIERDELASKGEYLCALLMAEYLGYEFVDASLWMRFTATGEADLVGSYEALSALAAGKRCVTPGFYGALPNGRVKTFPRGGSDITGAVAAAALEAEVYENWTDVSGILMADPRIVDRPKPLLRVSYQELRELSYVGAQILHEDAIAPVREKGIPINIRNTNRPKDPGTTISALDPNTNSGQITGVFGRKDCTLVSIRKDNLPAVEGYLQRLMEGLATYQIPVLQLAYGIDRVTFLTPGKKTAAALPLLEERLRAQGLIDEMTVQEKAAMIAVVSRRLGTEPAIAGRVLCALGQNRLEAEMLLECRHGLSFIVAVPGGCFEAAVRGIYEEFNETKGRKEQGT